MGEATGAGDYESPCNSKFDVAVVVYSGGAADVADVVITQTRQTLGIYHNTPQVCAFVFHGRSQLTQR